MDLITAFVIILGIEHAATWAGGYLVAAGRLSEPVANTIVTSVVVFAAWVALEPLAGQYSHTTLISGAVAAAAFAVVPMVVARNWGYCCGMRAAA
jgi:hypothetical protein